MKQVSLETVTQGHVRVLYRRRMTDRRADAAHRATTPLDVLYTHLRNKNDLLDGMIDAVISQIPMSADGVDWKTSLRHLVLAARSIMLRHPWAPRTVETRSCRRSGPCIELDGY